ncbi:MULTISPECIES: M3 family oligoendopeptidase [unclassified Helicobacter]|uniref:M3 family oligoendopeptidase n=1 Tax=unclassified Helicobacter TaxID=2593540 RepID=UPI000CF13A52|nr:MULTISPECIES: M3 family oligoendopeptidase [unclassified Helicobacter]
MKELKHYWDLKSLFENEEKAQDFLETLLKKAKDFEKKYKGKLAKKCLMILEEYENLLEGIGKVMTYAFLNFARDTNQGGFYAQCEMLCNQVEKYLLFFEVEFCAIDEKEQQKILKQAKKYSYFLEKIIEKKQYQLSLKEEKILLQLAPVGADAFARLFDEFFSTLKIPYQDNLKSEEEILSLLHHCDSKVRKDAQKSFSKELKKSQFLLGYILNMVRKNLQIQAKLRGYPNKETFRHLSNHISQKSVDSLIDTVNGNMDLVERYYLAKSKILGFKLKDYDRYAPISSQSQEVSYQDGLQTVLECFKNFSPVFYDIAQKAIKEGWIDSHPRDAKRGGAFSHGAVPSAHPYVLLNFTSNRRDVFTIAHEFGHMIHQELSKKQGYLNMDTPLTTAETASVFAEMLLFDHIKKSLSKEELLEVYASKIEDIFSTMFRQIIMTNFERRIHAVDEELKIEDFNRIWLEENKRMFGKSVKLTKRYGLWWSYIPHFIHSPFYCYAYAYGQLLVLALFGLYKKNKSKNFIKTYIDFLSKGGSASPKDLISAFGFNIEDPSFWEIGMQEVREMVREFEELL